MLAKCKQWNKAHTPRGLRNTSVSVPNSFKQPYWQIIFNYNLYSVKHYMYFCKANFILWNISCLLFTWKVPVMQPRIDFSMCLVMSKGSIYIRNQKNCNGFLTRTMSHFNTISSLCLDTNDSLPTHLAPGSTKAWNLNSLSTDWSRPETTQVNTHYHLPSLHKLHIPESLKPPVLVSIATTLAPPSLDAASSSSMVYWLWLHVLDVLNKHVCGHF